METITREITNDDNGDISEVVTTTFSEGNYNVRTFKYSPDVWSQKVDDKQAKNEAEAAELVKDKAALQASKVMKPVQTPPQITQ